ncbi:putative 2-methylcitrate dehydratase [Xylariaceae sp. AK1471]|nr:putative 2-methylcitrate dehydratase [Xylariaceae sp. AK1471]
MDTVAPDNNQEQPYDTVIDTIVDYAYDYTDPSPAAWTRGKAALLDAIGSAIETFNTSKECRALLGPQWPTASPIPDGFRVPGTEYSLDLLKGAFDMGALIRYLDHNDAFPGAEWGHPSDNLGAILATADILTRNANKRQDSQAVITMEQVVMAQIKAYEIQGCFQIRNAFNKVGLDHVILVKVASTAVVSWLMGLTKDQARAAVSHAWADGHPLRVYRQAPNAGPRKGWAAGDACMRAVHLATLARAGQPGLRTVLTTPRWGFYQVLYRDQKFEFPRPFGCWVMENVLFKVMAAEGHALTAVDAAVVLHRQLQERGLEPIRDIKSIHVKTTDASMTIINKQGPLHNYADRDHCLRYIVAVILLKGDVIEVQDYEDDSPWSKDPRVAELRSKMTMAEDEGMTRDYHNQDLRSLANEIEITLNDGNKLIHRVDFPVGHVRHEKTLALVREKALVNLGLGLPRDRIDTIVNMIDGPDFKKTPASTFIDLFQKN